MRAYTGAMNSSSPASLTYSPVEFCRNFCASRLRISRSFTQAATVTASTINKQGWIHRCIAAPSLVVGAPLCLIPGTQREQFFQQLAVVDACGLRGLREVFLRREVGIRIRLDDVDLSVGVHAVVDARAARESEAAIDTPR